MKDRLKSEIEHGKYVLAHGSGEIWNWETPAGKLRWARRVKMLSSHLQPGQKVLELGCGTGYFTRELAATGAQITAVDISPDLLEVARRECPNGNTTFEIQNACALTYPDETFDSVVGSSVLHHLEIDDALREIARVLKPGGSIYFTEPNMMNPQIAAQKNIPAIKKRLGDSPNETAFFRWLLQRRLERAGFRRVQIQPFDFLHPRLSPAWIPRFQAFATLLEHVPLISEIAGSLYIRAIKTKSTALHNDQYAEDRALTLRNRARLNANQNLLYWYRELYRHQFDGLPDPKALRILEVGSGVSPLQRFHQNVLTSDVLELDHLNYVFDCHSIDRFDRIANESLDVITLTNVLHHLKDPIDFLNKAAAKLKAGGKIIATEPYFSTLSNLIFRYLHHEPVDFDIAEPVLSEIRGPLASANSALPWLIFVKNASWRDRLRGRFRFEEENFQTFTSISYMATGGISRRLWIPGPIYRGLFRLDLTLGRMLPKLLASFFTIELIRK
jgi:ubiquinone/menaquinone biosynthesis C-methylase UbiE